MAQVSKNKAAPKAAAVEKKETLVYVGPNMSGDLLMTQFSTFRNGLPPHIEEKVKLDPDFKKLFVPVAELAPARNILKNPGSAIARAFNAVVKSATLKKEG